MLGEGRVVVCTVTGAEFGVGAGGRVHDCDCEEIVVVEWVGQTFIVDRLVSAKNFFIQNCLNFNASDKKSMSYVLYIYDVAPSILAINKKMYRPPRN